MDAHAHRTLEHYGLATGDPAAEVLSHYGIGPRARPATATEKALTHYGLAPSRRASSRPQEIDSPRDMEKLVGPLVFESEGEENLYFTDGDGQRWFFKYDGRERDAKRIRRYLTGSRSRSRSRTAGGWIDKAVAELAAEEGLDLEDMDIRNKEGRGYRVESDGGRGDSGESEWVVFKSDRDAEEYCVEYVEEMIDQDPGSFNPESLARFITIPDASTIASEDADSYWGDLNENRVLEESGLDDEWQELDEEWDTAEERIDEINDEFEQVAVGSKEWDALERESAELEGRQKQIDKEKVQLVEQGRVDGAEEMAEAKEKEINADPVEWLSDMGYDDTGKILDLNFVRIDTARAAQSFVDDDGVAHYLDRMDNYETDLDSGAVAFGIN